MRSGSFFSLSLERSVRTTRPDTKRDMARVLLREDGAGSRRKRPRVTVPVVNPWCSWNRNESSLSTACARVKGRSAVHVFPPRNRRACPACVPSITQNDSRSLDTSLNLRMREVVG